MNTLEQRDAAMQPATTRPATDTNAQVDAQVGDRVGAQVNTQVDTKFNTQIKPTSALASTVIKPSAWRRLRMTVARHPRLVQFGFLSAIATGTACFLLYSLFKDAWSPDQNNLAILQTIFKMELNRDSAQPIEGDPQRVVTRSFTSLEPYVAQEDWQWRNRFGSTTTYQKQDRWLIASCSPYSPLYLICDLSEIP